jgi:hypothetical protein
MSAVMDPAFRVKTLIALTEELTSIISRENALLAERRPQAILPLQDDKARLAAAYAQSIRQIAMDRTSISGAGAALIEELKSITRAFEERATEQRALLDGARRASEGVMRAVAAEAAAPAPGYDGRAERTPIILDRQA